MGSGGGVKAAGGGGYCLENWIKNGGGVIPGPVTNAINSLVVMSFTVKRGGVTGQRNSCSLVGYKGGIFPQCRFSAA